MTELEPMMILDMEGLSLTQRLDVRKEVTRTAPLVRISSEGASDHRYLSADTVAVLLSAISTAISALSVVIQTLTYRRDAKLPAEDDRDEVQAEIAARIPEARQLLPTLLAAIEEGTIDSTYLLLRHGTMTYEISLKRTGTHYFVTGRIDVDERGPRGE